MFYDKVDINANGKHEYFKRSVNGEHGCWSRGSIIVKISELTSVSVANRICKQERSVIARGNF